MAVMAVEARDLGKTYRRRRPGRGLRGKLRAYFSPVVDEFPAVKNLDFDIRAGEGVGLIGENGAGKSTIVKMLTGVMLPTHGSARTLGLDPWKQRRRVAMNIGVVFGQRSQLLWDLPAADSFRLLKQMYRIPDAVYAYTYAQAVERLELGPLLTTPVRFLSLGQRMRCDLAASLLHAPALAILDEPTLGLDVLAKIRAREFLRDLRAKFQMTLVLITHDLKDITLTCERVLVLDKGSLLFDGGIDGFRRRFSDTRSIVIDLHAPPDPDVAAALERALAALGAGVTWQAATRLRVSAVPAADVPKAMLEVLSRLDVQDLAVQGDDVEAMVARLFSAGKIDGD